MSLQVQVLLVSCPSPPKACKHVPPWIAHIRPCFACTCSWEPCITFVHPHEHYFCVQANRESLEESLGQRLLRMPPPAAAAAAASAAAGRAPAAAGAAGMQSSALAEPSDFRLPEEAPPFGSDPQAPSWNARQQQQQGMQRSPAPDDWEIEISQLHIDSKVAAGSFSNLYKGFYCGQEVAVKILKDLQDDASQYQEFLQEVSIMRKVGQEQGQNAMAGG